MIKTIYAIFDKKNASYSQFYITENEINLKRLLSYVVSSGNEQNFLHSCTEDFSLCKIGLIDDANGEVKNLPVEVVCELLSLKGVNKDVRKGNETRREENQSDNG